MYCTPPSVTSELLRNTVVLTDVELYPSPTLTSRCAEISPQMKKPIRSSKMCFIVYLLSIPSAKVELSGQKRYKNFVKKG